VSALAARLRGFDGVLVALVLLDRRLEWRRR
jgi:hypothetical protein